MVPPCKMFNRFLAMRQHLQLELFEPGFPSLLLSYRVLLMYMEIKCDLARAGSNDTQL